MKVQVFVVSLYAADGTLDQVLLTEDSRRRAEKAARRYSESYASEIQAGQSVRVEKQTQELDPSEFYGDCDPGDDGEFWEQQDARACAEERIAIHARRPSEY